MHRLNISRRSGFTLIELLVVVAIIAILASIAVPVISKAVENAKKAQARTELKTIETALRAYFNEYSKYPQGSGQADRSYTSESEQAQLMNVLRALNVSPNNNHVLNPRRIVFLEIPDGSLQNNAFIDPWGNVYRIVLDTNFDNTLTTSEHGTVRGRPVVVWSKGPDGDATEEDDLKSW